MPRPDNIEFDFDGNLWIAGGYKLLSDLSDSKAASSMVGIILEVCCDNMNTYNKI